MSVVCLFVNAPAFRQLNYSSYSYSVTCRNNQFCCSCKYYNFETVQPCNGTMTASPETGPSREAL